MPPRRLPPGGHTRQHVLQPSSVLPQPVHTHNGARQGRLCARLRHRRRRESPGARCRREATFLGIVRADGRVATRNYIGVLTSVNCSATAARAIADHFSRHTNPGAGRLPQRRRRGGADPRHGLRHGQRRLGMQVLRARWPAMPRMPTSAACWWWAWAARPTRSTPGWRAGRPARRRNAAPSTSRTPAAPQDRGKGVALIQEMLPEANRCSASRCSAATWWSACSAAARTATAASAPTRRWARRWTCWWPRRHRHPQRDARDLRRRAPADPPRRQPRGGREAGGPHPLVGGTTPDQRRRDEQQPVARQQGRRADHHPGEVAGRRRQGRHHQPGGVYEYAEPVTARGFVYMDTPGYDPVSATGQVAGGANLICFTTGRGSAYGCAPSPSLKLATNTALWQQAGRGHGHQLRRDRRRQRAASEMGAAHLRADAGHRLGQATKSERHGYGQNEFVPWQLGAVM
jgi:altronate hydrolase